MQDLIVSGGVESEAAEAVCALCGARLVSSSSLKERQDLLEFFSNKRGRELYDSQAKSDFIRLISIYIIGSFQSLLKPREQ